MPPRAKSAAQRVLARLPYPLWLDRCWTWPGATFSNGYGHVRGPGRGGGDLLVHVVTYEALIGPVPAGLVLDHGCRNRRCCNPYSFGGHRGLEPVTNQINILRGLATKLSVTDVLGILVRVRAGERQKDVAAAFGVRPATVSQIVARKRWANVHQLKGTVSA